MRDYTRTRAGLIAISMWEGSGRFPASNDLAGCAAVYQWLGVHVPISLRALLVLAGEEPEWPELGPVNTADEDIGSDSKP